MAIMIGNPGKERGDRLVYCQLSKLSDRFIIYAQPSIHIPEKSVHPDYVIIDKNQGVLVLEVKDWVEIMKVTYDKAIILASEGGDSLRLTSPVKQAREASYCLRELLGSHACFINHRGEYKGKLKFPVCYAGFLPHQPEYIIDQIKPRWGYKSLLGKPELDSIEMLSSKLDSFSYPFRIKKKISIKCIRALHKIFKPRVEIEREIYKNSLSLTFSGA